MKKIATLLFGIIIVLSFSQVALAQEKAKTKISLIKQNEKNVTFTVTSTKEFYVGGNKHVLHIGGKHFDLYEQNNDEGKGTLTFFIPKNDFNSLKDGMPVYLVYGEIEEGQNLDELCKQTYSPCWSLGKFNKKLMTK